MSNAKGGSVLCESASVDGLVQSAASSSVNHPMIASR
jgi:hypothetical protein